jgi:hypothetical protein
LPVADYSAVVTKGAQQIVDKQLIQAPGETGENAFIIRKKAI